MHVGKKVAEVLVFLEPFFSNFRKVRKPGTFPFLTKALWNRLQVIPLTCDLALFSCNSLLFLAVCSFVMNQCQVHICTTGHLQSPLELAAAHLTSFFSTLTHYCAVMYLTSIQKLTNRRTKGPETALAV